MKLLLDQGLPRSTVKHLVVAGVAAEHVGDLGLASAADAVILGVAALSRTLERVRSHPSIPAPVVCGTIRRARFGRIAVAAGLARSVDGVSVLE